MSVCESLAELSTMEKSWVGLVDSNRATKIVRRRRLDFLIVDFGIAAAENSHQQFVWQSLHQ